MELVGSINILVALAVLVFVAIGLDALRREIETNGTIDDVECMR